MDSRKRLVRRVRKHAEPDFDLWKNTIRDLYIIQKRTRESVSSYIQETYGFVATKYQYEKAFINWGWTKNVPASMWDTICPHLHYLTQQNTPFEMFYYAEQIKHQKIQKEMRNRPLQLHANSNVMPHSMPPGVTILLPPLDMTYTSLMVPSVCLFQQVPPAKKSLVSVGEDDTSFLEATIPHTTAISLNDFRFESHQLRPLQAVLDPQLYASNCGAFPINILESRLDMSFVHQQVLFSLANNFAGLNLLSMQQILDFALSTTPQLLSGESHNSFNPHTLKAVAHALFAAAIEVGNANVVKALLWHRSAHVDVNKFVCFANGRPFTPIERASGLQHRKTVEVLVRFGADVNHTYTKSRSVPSEPQGALQCAFDMFSENRKPDLKARPDPEIFQILLNAGASVSYRLGAKILAACEYGLFKIIQSQIHVDWYYSWFGKNRGEYQSGDYFPRYFESIGSTELAEFIQIILVAGVDLNCRMYFIRPGKRVSLIDIAAWKGYIDSVKLLLDKDNIISKETLFYAISSGNIELVRYLTAHGEAVKMNSTSAIDLLLGAMYDDTNSANMLKTLALIPTMQSLMQFACHGYALNAALSGGSSSTIELLVQYGTNLSSDQLGQALTIAIRNGQRNAARSLIDLGAPTSGHFSSGGVSFSPIVLALEARDANLVYWLLDAEANPAYYGGQLITTNYRDSCQAAVAWGDRQIMQALMDTDFDLDVSLLAAIAKRDLDLVVYLLQQGASVNPSGYGTGSPQSPLAKAANVGDVQIVEYLLAHGADPRDDKALLAAAKHHLVLCDSILRCYRARYLCTHNPCGSRNDKFGLSTLCFAIEENDIELFNRLICQGLSPGAVADYYRDGSHSSRREAPFVAAIAQSKNGDSRFVEVILQKKFSPQLVVSIGMARGEGFGGVYQFAETAFLVAISTGCTDMVRLFIKHKADIRYPARLNVKTTPLQQAADYGHLDIVRLLIRSGADVNEAPAKRNGGTALQLAAQGGYNAVIILLLSYGANVDGPTSTVNGRTALEGASENGRLDTVALLLNAGAASDGTDHRQIRSAIEYAVKNGFGYIRDMLEEYLATGSMKGNTFRAGLQNIQSDLDDADMSRWGSKNISIV